MKIKSIIVLLTAMFAVSMPAFAHVKAKSGYRYSDSIWLPGRGHNYSWRAVSRDELIIWASPSRPYLVKIWRPYTSLRHANYLGLSTSSGRLTRFDRVIVDGQRLPIRSIVALDRQTAKDLRWQKRSKRRY